MFANNLLSGPGIRNESESKVTLVNNLIGDFADVFTDPKAGDLHLARFSAQLVDRARVLAEVVDDIDGRPRGTRPDIGADELRK